MRKILFSLLFTGLTITSIAQLAIDNAAFYFQSGAVEGVQCNLTGNKEIKGKGLLLLNGTSFENVDVVSNTIHNMKLNNNLDAVSGKFYKAGDVKIDAVVMFTRMCNGAEFNLYEPEVFHSDLKI